MPGIQRQPLQKHNTPGSSIDVLVRNGSSFKMSANNAARLEPPDSLSAIRCRRPSQNCQTPTPSQGITTHVAAWQKRHPLSACAANGSGSSEGLSLPSRQPSARGHASKGELRPSCSMSTGEQLSCVCFPDISSAFTDLQLHAISSCHLSHLLYLSDHHTAASLCFAIYSPRGSYASQQFTSTWFMQALSPGRLHQGWQCPWSHQTGQPAKTVRSGWPSHPPPA